MELSGLSPEAYERHTYFMRHALNEAQNAFDVEEIPVGAVLVYKEEIIARSFNQREQLQNPIAHAEILVIENAAQALHRWRLTDTTLYVTLEPCAMCAGAMILSRIKEVVFALRDPRRGACGSVWNIANEPQLNHRIHIVEGIFAEESLNLLQKFFQIQRQKPKYRPKSKSDMVSFPVSNVGRDE